MAAALAVALSGCGGGDGLPRQAVSGEVTFEGKPLESGSITFVPTGPDQTSSAGGIIADGQYEIARNEGPTPGPYKVMIFTTSGGVEAPAEEEAAPGEFVPVSKKKASMVLPVRYNHESELTAQVEDGGKNVFNFALTK